MVFELSHVVASTALRAINKSAKYVVELVARGAIEFSLLTLLRDIEGWLYSVVASCVCDGVHVNLCSAVVSRVERF